MARKKNALRIHEIAEIDETDVNKVPTVWLPIAKWISEINDETDETSEQMGDYAGDGTPSTEVISIAEKWAVSGTYDAKDPAQELVASKKRTIGEERKVWHRITQTDGEVYQGIATLSDIKAGTGEATSYEEFSCTINFDRIPEKVTPEG